MACMLEFMGAILGHDSYLFPYLKKKVFGQMSSLNLELPEPLHVHVLDTGPGTSQLSFCFGL
jgi:hypothetical protein